MKIEKKENGSNKLWAIDIYWIGVSPTCFSFRFRYLFLTLFDHLPCEQMLKGIATLPKHQFHILSLFISVSIFLHYRWPCLYAYLVPIFKVLLVSQEH